MGMEMKLNLKLGQRLVMTPMLQQAIKLLQLTKLELLEEVSQELVENPVLEESSEITVTEREAKDQSKAEEQNKIDGQDNSTTTETSAGDSDAEDKFDDDYIDAFYKNYPIPRCGLPIDIARMALFMASDECSYSTGSEFVADGGLVAGYPPPGSE